MSGSSSEQIHRSTLAVYANLMEQFNPGLQKLVDLGSSYIQAFQALASCSEAYFSALAKMGDQALHTLSSQSLGEVLMQISETQKRLTAEMEGAFKWFQVEVLQAMQKNVKLDEEYIAGSRRVYEVEVRNQAKNLEKELRRGAYRDSLEKSDYMQYLRQSQQEILKEEQRRYRFVAEKHCALSQTLLFLINKTGASLLQKADGWKQKVLEAKSARPKTPNIVEQEAQLQASVNDLLQAVARDEDMSWAKREQLALGRVPSRAPSPVPTRARSSSVGESLGLGAGRAMRAIVAHPSSSNPKLLPFSRGEVVTVLVDEPRNGWLYGRIDSSMRQGWFPAAYVAPEDLSNSLSSSGASARSHSMNNLLEPSEDNRAPDDLHQGLAADTRPLPAPEPRPLTVPDPRPLSVPERKSDAAADARSTREALSPAPALSPSPSASEGPPSAAALRPSSPQPHRNTELTSPQPLKKTELTSPQPLKKTEPTSPQPLKITEATTETLSPPGPENPLFPRGTNPFATVKLKPTTTNDRSAPRIH